MFGYFHQNKFRYNEKGQLTPIFIVVIVVMIIMAMVTVNLSKVSFTKTESANAVDAGALAGGSVMANVFNGVAQANSEMEVAYWEFYVAISVAFVLALYTLSAASAQACPSPCTAVATIGKFIAATWAISIAVTAYHVAQNYFYLLIRRMAMEGREEAIKIAHRFTFINSGIGSKLKEGEPTEEMSAQQRFNYRDEFSDFLDKEIGFANSYTYAWQDGQERAHSATSTVSVEEVDTYDLRVAVLPFPAEIALLALSLSAAYSALASLSAACSCQTTYFACIACCGPHSPGCCVCAAIMLACWMANCAVATATMAPIFYLMAGAWAGLLPGPTITTSSASVIFIICWIDDIVHDRRFRVDTDQHHEGADLGLWQTRYPDIHSYSIVDFTGRGKIHPPVLRHDSSIVETDT